MSDVWFDGPTAAMHVEHIEDLTNPTAACRSGVGKAMKNARYEPRIRRLAGVLGMDWLPGTWVDKYAGKWWLVGSAGGDQPLPNTGGCATLPEALDAAEAWLAPQIDLPECSICRRRHGSEVVHACE